MLIKCAKCGLYIRPAATCFCGFSLLKQNVLLPVSLPQPQLNTVASAAKYAKQAPEGTQSEIVYEGIWGKLREEALSGSTSAMCELNNKLRNRGHISEANMWLRMAAEYGDAHAQLLYGHLFDMGDDVEQDFAEAGKWYRLASKQGNPNASWHLGNLYWQENGEGQGKNFDEAVKWFLLAARQAEQNEEQTLDKALGLFDLGVMYMDFEGHEPDPDTALKYFLLAAERGNVTSQSILGDMYSAGDEIPKNLDEARRWYSIASENGDSDAQKRLEELGG